MQHTHLTGQSCPCTWIPEPAEGSPKIQGWKMMGSAVFAASHSVLKGGQLSRCGGTLPWTAFEGKDSLSLMLRIFLYHLPNLKRRIIGTGVQLQWGLPYTQQEAAAALQSKETRHTEDGRENKEGNDTPKDTASQQQNWDQNWGLLSPRPKSVSVRPPCLTNNNQRRLIEVNSQAWTTLKRLASIVCQQGVTNTAMPAKAHEDAVITVAYKLHLP